MYKKQFTMSQLTKPAAFLLYFLSLVVFLLAGFTFAAVTNVAEGQGLAGGAIVFNYGVLFAIIGLIGALFFVFYVKHEKIIIANRMLAVILAIAICILVYKGS